MQNKQKWRVYINGYRVAETKSIGYKWVYYRTSEHTRYKKIKRSVWDKACLSTLAEQQEKSDIRNNDRKLKSISKKDKETLLKIADMMAKANEK